MSRKRAGTVFMTRSFRLAIPQSEWLRERAEKEQLSESEILRRVLSFYISEDERAAASPPNPRLPKSLDVAA